MNIILLSGGSGKRLWPLSNEARSKQFIQIFKNEETGEHESMVQRMYRSIKRIDPNAKITIATSKSQVSELRNQLGGGIDISIEPCRRDTFPAIVLAAVYLHDAMGVSENEAIVVCPVDPYVEDDYFKALSKLFSLAAKGDANLTLMGMEPTYPSEKYGYIIPSTKESISAVSEFKEKPDAETAKKYIEEGALWNAGIFAFKLGYLLNKAHQLIEFKDYYDLLDKYSSVKKISFDYAVVEHESSIQVIRFAGAWKDLGTWNTFAESMSSDAIGKVVIGSGCENVKAINSLDIPVLCMGLKDVIVASSPEGILVTSPGQSANIKPFVDQFDSMVRFADKSWGRYEVVDVSEDSLTIKATLQAGHGMSYHSHERRNEIWNVVSGRGRVIVDGMSQHIHSGDVIAIQAGCRHTVFADTDLVLIEVQIGKDISVFDKKKHKLG